MSKIYRATENHLKVEKRNPITCVFCGTQIGLTHGVEKSDGLCNNCDK